MKIEQRVISAIQSGQDGDYFGALNLICPAIEATARKKYKKAKITSNGFNNFLNEYNNIIEAFIGSGLNLEDTRFPDFVLTTDADRIIKNPTILDIIYHVFRCALAHGHEIPEEFDLTSSPDQGHSIWEVDYETGGVRVPDKLVWALIAVVVFCDSNKDISTETTCRLTWGGAQIRGGKEPYRFDVDLFWGAEEVVRRFLAKQNLIRVAIKPQ